MNSHLQRVSLTCCFAFSEGGKTATSRFNQHPRQVGGCAGFTSLWVPMPTRHLRIKRVTVGEKEFDSGLDESTKNLSAACCCCKKS